MKKYWIGALVGLLLLTGCGQRGISPLPEGPQETAAKRIGGLLAPADLPGAMGNEGLRLALNHARDDRGARIELLEPLEFGSPLQSLSYLAENGYQLVLTTDSRVEGELAQLKTRYPGTHFVLLSRQNPGVKEETTYHLAGYMAAALSKTKGVQILYDGEATQLSPALAAAFQGGVGQFPLAEGQTPVVLPPVGASLAALSQTVAQLKGQPQVDCLLVVGDPAFRQAVREQWNQGGAKGPLLGISFGEPNLTPGYHYLELPLMSGVEAVGVIEEFFQGKTPEGAVPGGKPILQAFFLEGNGQRTPTAAELVQRLRDLHQTLP